MNEDTPMEDLAAVEGIDLITDDEAAEHGDDALAEMPDVDDDAFGTPYTDGTDDVEPIPDETDAAVLPSYVTAFIRTATPLIVGWLLSALVWAADVVGFGGVPTDAEAWLAGAVPVVLSALYYVLAKWLEQRFPKVPWLGSTRRPLYTAPASSKQPAIMALASSGYVWWRGGKFTPAFRDSLVEADKLAPGFVLTQGGFNGTKVSASAGTHAGDAADFSVKGKTKAQVAKFIESQRRVGNAAWFRTTKVAKWGTRAHGFNSYHVHVVPNGYAAPSAGAKAQVSSWKNGIRAGYRHGRDGLASNQADLGPGHTSAYRTRTWFDYKKTKAGTPSTGWDGRTYPGKSAFVLGKKHPAVKVLGTMLVSAGHGKYKVGPGETFTTVDKSSVTSFQRAQGWSGSDADGYPGPETWRRLVARHYKPQYPGKSAFVLGKKHPAVKVLGTMLVSVGHGKYKVGPGETFTTVDKASVTSFQRAQGWSGSDADGYPGPETWRRLVNNHYR